MIGNLQNIGNLKNAYQDKGAIIITGGASVLNYSKILNKINRNKYIIFIESKAITHEFLSWNVKPDYILASYPDKLIDNSLQSFIYRSFLVGFNISYLLKKKYLFEYEYLKNNFDSFFEEWQMQKTHKRYKYKKNIILKNSPYELIRKLPEIPIITNLKLLKDFFPLFDLKNVLYNTDNSYEATWSSVEEIKKNYQKFFPVEYFNPIIKNNTLIIYPTYFLNVAAISIYPILSFFGFKKTFFMGMDMNMLGTFEYSAQNTFKSMLHFWYFIMRARRSFNANYIVNKPYYLRPKSEFLDLKKIIKYLPFEFIRVYEPSKYVPRIEDIKTISPYELIK